MERSEPETHSDEQTATQRSERGASLVEYALLLALIAIVCIVAVGVLGGSTNDLLDQTGSVLAQ